MGRIAVSHDLIGRHGSVAPVLRRCLATLGPGKRLRVLDVGAFDRAFGKALDRCGFTLTYHSLDVDGSAAHDFRSIEEVRETYDAIAMFELIEHLSYEDVDKLLHAAYGLLAPGGCLLVSTPNPLHPERYFSDASHKQHWPAHDLYALLRHVGFAKADIEMLGVVYMPLGRLRRGLTYCRNLAWRVMGLETRGGILAIATRKGDGLRPGKDVALA